MRYYLGSDNVAWLWRPDMAGVPLFISHHRLKVRKTPFPRTTTTYALDSGAYTELSRNGRWLTSPEQYVAALRRYWEEIGPFDWAAQQDSMCSADVIEMVAAKTGHRPTVREQQEATVANFLLLRDLAPDLPIVPVLQGDTHEAYLRCADMFEAAGVDLRDQPVVGVGSLVARPASFIERLGAALADRGLTRLHGFGVKGSGLRVASQYLVSADSQAWSAAGRHTRLPGCSHDQCSHCPKWARRWLDDTMGAVEQPRQLGLAV